MSYNYVNILHCSSHFGVNPGKKSRVEFFNWQSAVPRVADQIECLLSAGGGGE